jgi:Domain of unknown function (DUF4395)
MTESTVSLIPMPIVTLNRLMLAGGVALAIAFQQPLLIAALFLMMLGAVSLGPRGSLPFQLGKRFLAGPVARAKGEGRVEDRRLMRFNNTIALMLFGLALVAFTIGQDVLGYVLSGMVMVAASVALAGFCLGCFLYYRLRLAQFRWSRAG